MKIKYWGTEEPYFLFESDGDDYYEPIKTSNAVNSIYIEYESNSDKNKSLSIKEYLNKIRPYLTDMIKTQGERKIELTVAIGFMSSEDSEDSNENSLHIKRWNHWRTFWISFAKVSRTIRRINERK